MAAALNADAAMLELLIKAGADVNATNQAGATALMRAATFEDKVRLLVAKGADVKARSHMGNNALILAARKPGNSRTVKFLLDRGADPNATNRLWRDRVDGRCGRRTTWIPSACCSTGEPT